MLKNLHKNGVQRVYREAMVVLKQALLKLCLFLPMVENFQITWRYPLRNGIFTTEKIDLNIIFSK